MLNLEQLITILTDDGGIRQDGGCSREPLNKPIIPWSRVCRADRLRPEPSLTVLALRFGAMAGVLVA
jgi:hypothetical protein